MDYSEWDINKLPDFVIQELRDYYIKRNYVGMIEIHDEYKLSNNNYCCSIDGVLKNVEKILHEAGQD